MLERVKEFMALLSFLTVIPTGVHDLKLASRSFYLAPIVGLIEGSVAVVPILLGAPSYVEAALILAISCLITGFSHLDGFADFADALGSGRRGEDALRVMKGTERGAVAIAAITLLLLVAYSSLVGLVAEGWWHVILLSHVLASESMYLLALVSAPPSYNGLGRDFVLESKHRARAMANLLAFGAILLVISAIRREYAYHQLAMIAPLILSLAYTRTKSHELLGFASGDVLGFCYELTKVAVLIFSAALTPLRI